MADVTQLQQVSDDDNLFEGYFNEIGEFYVEHTDTGGPFTHNAASWNKEVTFTFSGLTSNYVLKRIEFEDLSLSSSSANSGDEAYLGVRIDDGSSYYSLNGNVAQNSPAGTANSPKTKAPFFINQLAGSGTDPDSFMVTRNNTSVVVDYVSFPVPFNLITGATTYNVAFYLYATQTAGNTATLASGFKCRLVFCKRPQDLGTSTAQA